jgi:hypothetical protein
MDTKDQKQVEGAAPASTGPEGAAANDGGAKGGDMERAGSGSKEGSEAGIGGKKKPKKKKRSVLANQSNPHHVDNCKLKSHRCKLTARSSITNSLYDH